MIAMPESVGTAMRIGAVLVLTAAIVACGGPAASSQPASDGGSPAPASAASDAPSGATPEPTPSLSLAIPSLDANTPLVDIMPAQLAGAETHMISVVGSDLSAFDGSTAMIFESILTILGATGADMTVGIASTDDASIVAIRVKGKPAADVGKAMIDGRALNATTTKEDVELGGKQVAKITTTTTRVPFYVYASGDVSFTIAATDEATVAEALSKLP